MTKAKVDSTSDERIVNNSNLMRHQYRVLDEYEKKAMVDVKDKGLDLCQYLDSLGSSRELSIAKTRVEEAVMWAVKHVTG